MLHHIIYDNRKVELSVGCFDVDKSSPQWYHYFLCGYRGVLEHFGISGTQGLDILCDGTVPRCSGLASSSALVCCSALVTMHTYDKQLSRVTSCLYICYAVSSPLSNSCRIFATHLGEAVFCLLIN